MDYADFKITKEILCCKIACEGLLRKDSTMSAVFPRAAQSFFHEYHGQARRASHGTQPRRQVLPADGPPDLTACAKTSEDFLRWKREIRWKHWQWKLCRSGREVLAACVCLRLVLPDALNRSCQDVSNLCAGEGGGLPTLS